MKLPQILSQANIKHFDGHGHHHARYGWVQLDCPFCGRDTGKFHMGYNKNSGHFTCWRCGGHSFVNTIMELLGVAYGEAKELRDGLQLAPIKNKSHTGRLKLPKGLGPLQRVHKDYLRSRKFNPAKISKLWQVQGIGMSSGGLSWRIFIPIRYKGEVVSWTSRSVTDKGLRYISAASECESIPHKTLLYGSDFVSTTGICVEGPTDVWSVGPGGLGTCGTGFSQSQVEKLSRLAVRAVWFDPGVAAQRRAQDLVDQLSVFPGETYNIVTDKDPGETSREEVKQIRKEIGL